MIHPCQVPGPIRVRRPIAKRFGEEAVGEVRRAFDASLDIRRLLRSN